MGIEESLIELLKLNRAILATIQQSQDVTQIHNLLQQSVNSFAEVAKTIELQFQESARNIIRGVQESYSGLNPEVLTSIGKFPDRLDNLDTSLTDLGTIFQKTEIDIKEDLQFIKISYVEDVIGNMRNLSERITEMVESSTEKTSNQYEASINSFVSISEDLKQMQSNLNALIENQADQLATVAEVRDRVSAIIQVELASLRDHININLENSVNELKTSVTERLMVQDGSIQNLTQAIEKLNQVMGQLPTIIKNEINLAMDTKIAASIENMEKESRKTAAITRQSTKTVDDSLRKLLDQFKKK
ncbi:MAG: hypothetical protein ACXACP_13550 [Candidatus Hodarchaeales archaeon]